VVGGLEGRGGAWNGRGAVVGGGIVPEPRGFGSAGRSLGAGMPASVDDAGGPGGFPGGLPPPSDEDMRRWYPASGRTRQSGAMIAVLGTGLLGSGFARALRRADQTVHVWNRTTARARALEVDGANAFDSPADAIRGASRIHLVLTDDAAVDSVLAAAAPESGLRVFDHSTTSPGGALARTERWAERGVSYLHAPVFMGPQNALESTGLMLVSGDRAVVETAKPLLTPMTGKLIDLGPRVDAAAAFKLLGNLFLMALTAGFADMLALAKAMHIAPTELATLFDHFNPGASVPARFKRMLEAHHGPPSWELAMARKDARLMQDETDRAELVLTLLPAFAARMDAVIAQGHGRADWTVVGKDFL
jgi:3-hydroxyisobutyrate dehydrogenase